MSTQKLDYNETPSTVNLSKLTFNGVGESFNKIYNLSAMPARSTRGRVDFNQLTDSLMYIEGMIKKRRSWKMYTRLTVFTLSDHLLNLWMQG